VAAGTSFWQYKIRRDHAARYEQLPRGRADPVAVLKKYPGRARSIHIKSHGAGPEAVVGEGDIDWPAVFAFCEGKGRTEWYVVEHETSKNPLDAVKRSMRR